MLYKKFYEISFFKCAHNILIIKEHSVDKKDYINFEFQISYQIMISILFRFETKIHNLKPNYITNEVQGLLK